VTTTFYYRTAAEKKLNRIGILLDLGFRLIVRHQISTFMRVKNVHMFIIKSFTLFHLTMDIDTRLRTFKSNNRIIILVEKVQYNIYFDQLKSRGEVMAYTLAHSY
jgi:hypothetical protein